MTALLDRLHSTLSRIEGEIDGYKVEIIRGAIVMSPVRPFHGKTIHLLWGMLEPQLPREWDFISDVRSPFPAVESELCPDLAIIPRVEADRNLSEYLPELLELAVEVVSPGSVKRDCEDEDYEDKAQFHASAGVPVYVILDPYQAVCVVMREPGPYGYQERTKSPYGTMVAAETPLGELTIDTARLPAEKDTRALP